MGIEDTLANNTDILHGIAAHLASHKKVIRGEDGKISHVITEDHASQIEAARHEAMRDFADALREVLGENETAQLVQRIETHRKK